MRNPGSSAASLAAGLWISLITLDRPQMIKLIPKYNISVYTEQPWWILKHSESVHVLHILEGSEDERVHMRRMSFIYVGHKLQHLNLCVGNLLQKQSKLDFLIKVEDHLWSLSLVRPVLKLPTRREGRARTGICKLGQRCKDQPK